MKKLVLNICFLLPFVCCAQKEELLRELSSANKWFFAQRDNSLSQEYIYYKDSIMSSPVDSMECRIIKRNNALHCKLKDLESFTDSGYSVKISHTGKYILVYKSQSSDSAKLMDIFSGSFDAFARVKRSNSGQNCTLWELTGGTAGIKWASVLLGKDDHHIRYIVIGVSGNYAPLIAFRNGEKTGGTSVIKIRYTYSPKGSDKEPVSLHDFISFSNDHISPAQRFKEYDLKLLTQGR